MIHKKTKRIAVFLLILTLIMPADLSWRNEILADDTNWFDASGDLPRRNEGSWYYYVLDGRATISGYIGLENNVTIPEVLGGYPVVEIGDGAFYRNQLTSINIHDGVTSIGAQAFYLCIRLESVIIGNGVTRIGFKAFSYCQILTSIVIGNSVTSIDDEAFMACYLLEFITIPDSVTSIGDKVFESCTRLTSITVSANNENYMSDDGILYNKSKSILIYCPSRKTSVTIPDGVISIANRAFERCFDLTSVEIPNSVTRIGNYSFYLCRELTSIEIPNSVTFIGDNAFERCSKITSIVIPSSVDYIGMDAFYDIRPLNIIGFLGTSAEEYVKTHKTQSNGLTFTPLYGVPYITLNLQYLDGMTNNQTISVQGYANGEEVIIYIDNVQSVKVPIVNFRYNAEISLPVKPGTYEISAVTVFEGEEVRATKTVIYNPSLPSYTLRATSATSSGSPIDLRRLDGITDILWFANGRPITFEIAFDLSNRMDISGISEVNIVEVNKDDSIGNRKISAAYKGNGKWIAIDQDPDANFYLSNKLAVEWVWRTGSDDIEIENILGFVPDADGYDNSILMPNTAGSGVTTYCYIPDNASSNSGGTVVNPNEGWINLTKGLRAKAENGSNIWEIDVTEEAVGKTYVFWAHGGKYKEYIFATFDAPGTYPIGTNQNGMNHLSYLGSIVEGGAKSGIIGYGRYRIAIDPSGYVYEAVPSNRLEGVKTSLFYQEDDGSAVFWDAEEYEQENPLYTNKEGVYGWDVPGGWWQVKCELDGFEPAYSEWVPVPPEQTEVDIGMISRAAPTVTRVNGYPEGIDIKFSKYMIPGSLTDNKFTIIQNGKPVNGIILYTNLENSYDGTKSFSSVIRFVPGQALSGSVQITVDADIRSYADIRMDAPYTETVIIVPEPKTIIAQGLSLGYGETDEIVVSVEPADAAVGKTVTAVSGNPYIAGLLNESAVLDENGQAVFNVEGHLPGLAAINFFLDDTLLSAEAGVSVGMSRSRREERGYQNDDKDEINDAIRKAKKAIEDTLFEPVAQSVLNTKSAAREYVEEIIDGLSLNGVKATVVDGTFIAAVADSDYVRNGQYNFTVTLSKSGGSTLTTDRLTLEITAENIERSEFIKIPCTLNDEIAPNKFINLTDETIELGEFLVAAYSVNGGVKWIKGNLPTGSKWNALFDKSLELWVTDKIDNKGKPTSDAEILRFPAIMARPKVNAEKLVPFYNSDNVTWVLSKKGDTSGESVYEDYEFCHGVYKGRTLTPTLDWEPVSQFGFNVTEKPPKNEKKKVYFMRSSAKAGEDYFIPASKQFKVSPAVYSATPKVKIDYTKEIIKLKKGFSYSVDAGSTYKTVDGKEGLILDVADNITNKTSIHIQLNATGKKPASQIQVITPFERGRMTSTNLTCAKGKIVTKLSVYEILNPADGKWGGLPKTTSSTQYYIRLKQTKTAAKSEIYLLDIKFGFVEATKKNGIIAATLVNKPTVD